MNMSAHRIATFMVACKVSDTEKRYITRATDFTDADKAEIKATEARVENILTTMNGRKWSDVLKALRGIATESFHIGFREQDRILAYCAKNGLYYATYPFH